MQEVTQYQDMMYSIAIREPEPGIEDKVLDAIRQGRTLTNPKTVVDDYLSIITYEQRNPADVYSHQHSSDREQVEHLLWKDRSEYVILNGGIVGNESVDEAQLTAVCNAALDITSYHDKRAMEGELPNWHTIYRFRVSSDIKPKDLYAPGDVYEPHAKPRDVEFTLPLSAIVVARQLRRVVEQDEAKTNVYAAGPATSDRFSENDVRRIMESMSKYWG